MSGLDKIIQDIKAQADAKAEELLTAAKEKADAVIAEAQKDADKQMADAEEKARRDSDQVIERAHSSAQLRQQKMILEKKQELIEQVMDKAKETIRGLSDEDYFSMIEKMASRFSLSEPGVIRFSKKDLDRLPAGFADKIRQAVGGDVKVAEEPADIDGGFVLGYGGIEENCSLKALFTSMRDRLQDKVNEALW